MARQNDLYIAHSSTWKRQVDIDTPRALSDLDAVMDAVRPEHVRTEKNLKDIFDCSQQFLRKRKVLSQLGRLNIEVTASARNLAGLFYAAMGVAGVPSGAGPYTHAVTMLGKTAYQLPFFTFNVGFNTGSDPGMLFQSAVANRLNVSGRGLDDIVARVEWVGFAPVPTVAYTWPACADTDPITIFDGALSIGGEDRLTGADQNHTTRAWEFFIDNGLLTGDHAFPVASLNPRRLQRNFRRTWGLRWTVEGEEGDAVHDQMIAGPGTDVPFSLRVGATTDGVTVTCPHALLAPDNNQEQAFEGEANQSVLQALLTPLMIGGVLPFSVSAVNTQSTQMGLTA